MEQKIVRSKTIEIDDGGTGDLVGDAFVGFHAKESGRIIFRNIPVAMYNGKNHETLKDKEWILEAVKSGLKGIAFDKNADKIQICRGSCFDLARKWFDEVGIDHEPAIVEGKLQDAIEGKFIDHLRKLGVKSKNLTKEAGAKRYFVLFNWVCYDLPNREKFVKSGFPAWQKKWRNIAKQRYEERKRGKSGEWREALRKRIEERAEEIIRECGIKE